MGNFKRVNWGFIGCGNVAEVKSGPAFNKIKNSNVVGVYRRDQLKSKDFALRHGIGRTYNTVVDLLKDDAINAVYIATPPNTHRKFTIMASDAGKAVYVEKPMAMNYNEAFDMVETCKRNKTKLFVAHYRRYLPKFLRVKKLLESKEIGDIRFVSLRFLMPLKHFSDVGISNWRVQPEISGGGYFHDLAPHQLDLLSMLFGKAIHVKGNNLNQVGIYSPDDIVTAQIEYENQILMNATWCFTLFDACKEDSIEIFGEKGKISFSVFNDDPVVLINQYGEQILKDESLENVQLPTINSVVTDLLGGSKSYVSGSLAMETTRIMDEILA